MIEETINRISRLLFLINELDRGKVYLPLMAQKFCVTNRTIQRDIRVLENAGFVISPFEKGSYGFMDGYSLQKMQLSDKEAVMLVLFSDIAEALGDNFTTAFEHLRKRVLQEPAVNPFYIKILKGNSYNSTPLSKTIENAVSNNEKLSVKYDGVKKSDFMVSPLKIAWFDGFWYLLALGRSYALLKLRLEKIKGAQKTGEYFKKPANIEKFLNESISIWLERERKIKVEIKICAKAAKYFKEKTYFPKQKITKTLKNGDCILQCWTDKAEEILPTIFSWLPHITIISPPTLAAEIQKQAKEYLKRQKEIER
ncbi:MAG: WYL domain-containing protein [Endomicrobium sp.]|jgi:predicted DNA-binding transcriptional regulator YafY|nr:WYL domain-containing protein [Endomicrobium sp.]